MKILDFDNYELCLGFRGEITLTFELVRLLINVS